MIATMHYRTATKTQQYSLCIVAQAQLPAHNSQWKLMTLLHCKHSCLALDYNADATGVDGAPSLVLCPQVFQSGEQSQSSQHGLHKFLKFHALAT